MSTVLVGEKGIAQQQMMKNITRKLRLKERTPISTDGTSLRVDRGVCLGLAQS